MTQHPLTQKVFRLCDGDAVLIYPANISRRGIEDLRVELALFIEGLVWPGAEQRAFLRGLAELAAYEANSWGPPLK
jgi:hypothetical protein